jgi:hypothetical protein
MASIATAEQSQTRHEFLTPGSVTNVSLDAKFLFEDRERWRRSGGGDIRVASRSDD